jgi:hypothetical protein
MAKEYNNRKLLREISLKKSINLQRNPNHLNI